MKIRTIVALGCTLALTGVISARAAGQSEADAAREIENQPVQVSIRFGDLDLASQGGSEAMLQRISQAALKACGASGFSLQDYRWATKRSGCYHSSMDRAVAELAAPAVTQLYEQRRDYASNVGASN